MTKVLKCNDLNPGCTFEAKGNTDEDVLKKAAEHAKTAHNMEEVPPDVLDKARRAIRNEAKAWGKKQVRSKAEYSAVRLWLERRFLRVHCYTETSKRCASDAARLAFAEIERAEEAAAFGVDFLLELKDAVNKGFGARRAAGDVYIHRNHLIHTLNNGVVVEDPT